MSRTTQQHVQLRCPRCGACGRIDWSRLGRPIRCHQCTCHFTIMRDGSAVPLSELPQVRYACPRCHDSGTVAVRFAAQGTPCPRCQLPLVMGPDHCLRGAEKIPEGRPAPTAAPGRLARWLRIRDSSSSSTAGHERRFRALAGAAMLVALVVAAMVTTRALYDASPSTQAKRLLRHCLAGNIHLAKQYVEDTALQQIEFERWHLRHLTSLRDDFRPRGDRMEISVETVAENDETATLNVILRSEAIGQRTYSMQWHRRDRHWLFDAAGTLAAVDQRMRTPVPSRSDKPQIPQRRQVSPALVPSGAL